MEETPRLKAKKVVVADAASAYRESINANATILDSVVMYLEGPAAERPAAGVKGRVHYATDTHVYSLDNGTLWLQMAAGNRGSSSVTFAAGALTAPNKTIAHNLGVQASAVILTPFTAAVAEELPLLSIVSLTETQFSVQGTRTSAAKAERVVSFYWLALP